MPYSESPASQMRTNGVKTLTFNAQFTNGTTQTTYSNLTVEAFSAKAIPDEIVDVNATIAFTPYETEQFSNIKGRGRVGYYYHPTRQASKTLSKVAIILDGFDVGDTRKFVDLYEDKMAYGTEPNKKYVVEELQNDGFDVLILNFPIYKVGTQSKTVPSVYRDGGGDYVERNAFVLVELIEQVKAKLIASGSNERIIIIGPSMGGLISRYALTYMEKNNLEHRCKLWISFDSPHRGANINIGDQLMFEYLNRGLGFMQAIKDAMAQLDSKAARQMLLHHYTAVLKPLPGANPEIIAGSPNYRERFVQGLDNLGFPQNPCIRNVALNNGSKVGNLQKNEPNNANPTGGSEALTFFTKKKTYLGAIFPGLALAIGGQLSLNMYNSPAYNQRSSVFKSNYKRGLFFSPSIENRFIKGNPLSNSLDIVPGGYYRVNDDIKNSESGIIGVDVKFAEQSFIPLVSSMALYNTNRDWGMNLQSIVLNPSPSDTPFKAIHAAPTLNENHVEITSAGIQFIRDQILYRNQNIPSGCNN
jgi:hypothetical protein